ncbi:GNAT family N-acetyltransferase [Bacillus luteolus]|uniref:GNAT family N-acetyltransferase n=1 Tax=Litchfieldia luteola TaxID=682179 RepID=A0ABR9QHE2_9BACI|nr:GNAT family N-acetyltransferase [Cytobacillus luteolus]MBE4907649.1 GNAT family N-acetyltransferase [Cytobacillus luteolus]MBP1941100.1 RimJ/RimL family protein N-acetyltransferase [Cytobacillus luteolus]
MKVIETDRLILRLMTKSDAPFILKLLNDESWLRFIGDKGVKTLEDAEHYILTGPIEMYEKLGFGLYIVELKDNSTPIGMCGLIKRITLEDIDIGFALLTEFQSNGYAYEAAAATLLYGSQQLGLKRIVAITTINNTTSSTLLKKLGMTYERNLALPHHEEDLKYFSKEF